MIVSRGWVFAVAVALCWSPAAAKDKVSKEQKKYDQIQARIKSNAMIFFVAKGGADACGRGCSTWIAAEGSIDRDAAQRFRAFIVSLPDSDLPVYFNSNGGIIEVAMALGRELRERRVIVGIGRTVADGCGDSARLTEPCRRILQAKSEHRARLITRQARCFSACAYALLGGSTRRIASGAQFGIHAARPPVNDSITSRLENLKNGLKRYTLEMGVDAKLIDAAFKVSPDDMRIVKREEIDRFGVESAGFYETPWSIYRHNVGSSAILKSWSSVEPGNANQHRTTSISLFCGHAAGAFYLTYRQEVGERTGPTAALRLSLGGQDLALSLNTDGSRVVVASARINLGELKVAAKSSTIEAIETVSNNAPARRMSLSAAGLLEAIADLEKQCSWNAAPSVKWPGNPTAAPSAKWPGNPTPAPNAKWPGDPTPVSTERVLPASSGKWP